jgi:hypothetical protein
MATNITGITAVKKRMDRYAADLQRETLSVLRQEARALCIELGAATLPGPGLSESTGDKFRKTVESDVRKVFASRKNPSAIYRLMMIHAPHMAGAYWSAVKSGKTRAAADLVRRAGLPQGLDPAALRTARAGKQARVLKNQNPISLATEAQVNAFARKQGQLVGVAKAGWYCAAKGLGGRVRRNIVSPFGKRATAEAFPSYVRKLARRYPQLGGARVIAGKNPRVEIFTNVRHAKAALPGGFYRAAVSAAGARIRRDLEFSMKVLAKRGQRRAA